MLELLKLIVQPVVLERNEHGVVTGERLGEATPLYSREQLLEFFDTLDASLAIENERVSNGNQATRRKGKAHVTE